MLHPELAQVPYIEHVRFSRVLGKVHEKGAPFSRKLANGNGHPMAFPGVHQAAPVELQRGEEVLAPSLPFTAGIHGQVDGAAVQAGNPILGISSVLC